MQLYVSSKYVISVFNEGSTQCLVFLSASLRIEKKLNYVSYICIHLNLTILTLLTMIHVYISCDLSTILIYLLVFLSASLRYSDSCLQLLRYLFVHCFRYFLQFKLRHDPPPSLPRSRLLNRQVSLLGANAKAL